MAEMTETNMEYQMFKGLQRPLEFMGLQGRYITWAAVTAIAFVYTSKGRLLPPWIEPTR